MKIITCSSYYGTGSSAVTDLFSECTGVYSLGDTELRFIQDPHGISDLEYNLIENNHRHNTSNAIKEYLKYIKVLNSPLWSNRYNKVFCGEFYSLSLKYIESITQLQCRTWWHQDSINKGLLFCITDRVYSKIRKLLSARPFNSSRVYSLLNNREYGYYSYISEDYFLEKTQEYVHALFAKANKENCEFLMVDQLLPPSNISRYVRYFYDDIKVIAVDRDPRDIYLSEKFLWKWGVIPVTSVKEFVKWFKITRKHREYEIDDPQTVFRLRFEDLVYNYDVTKELLFKFIGIPSENHVKQKQYFDPYISIKNTNLRHRYNNNYEIKYIENELNDFLYDFPC